MSNGMKVKSLFFVQDNKDCLYCLYVHKDTEDRLDIRVYFLYYGKCIFVILKVILY